MSTSTLSHTFEDFECVAQNSGVSSAHKAKPPLRLTLLDREQLRLPSSSEWLLRVYSGQAWVSFAGEDFYLKNGECLSVPRVRDGAIISAVDGDALFFEVT